MTKLTKKGKTRLADQRQRERYNSTVHRVSHIFRDLEPLSNHIYIRLFQYDQGVRSTPSGVLDPNQVERHSDSGRIGSKLETPLYKAVGIVLAYSKSAKDFMKENFSTVPMIGDVVWIDPKSLMSEPVFIAERDYPGKKYEGYIKIHPSSIEFIDPSKNIKLEYEREEEHNEEPTEQPGAGNDDFVDDSKPGLHKVE